MDKNLKVRSGEHIEIWPLTFKKIKPSKESAIHDHLLNYNSIPSFEEFTILTNGNNKFVLEIKKKFLIKRDRLWIEFDWIKTIALLNDFYLAIVSFLLVSLYNNIFWL